MTDQDKYWVGFDLGGTKMLACVFDDALAKLSSRRRKTDGSAGQEAGLARIIKTILQAPFQPGGFCVSQIDCIVHVSQGVHILPACFHRN